MYVKVVPLAAGEPPRQLSTEARLYRVDNRPGYGDVVSTGRVFLTEDPNGDWVAALGIESDAWSIEFVDDGHGPTSTYDGGLTGGVAWDLRWAWWWTRNAIDEPVQHWIVTGGRIYILGENGQTIDSVN